MSPYTKILLREVAVTVRVGLAPWERERAQRVVVDVELYAEPDRYLASATAASIVDYRPVYDRVRRWQSRPHTDVLETLVNDLLDACFEDAQVVACRVSIRKVEALDEASAGVETSMTRRDYEYRHGRPVHRPNTPRPVR